MASEKVKNFLAGTSLADVAAPAGSIIATGINALATARQNKLNREWTERQNDLAWQRQRQLIDEQRAYDTPKAQMQRLMEAGLNPNLIYGGVDQSPMQAQSAPNASGKYAGVAPQVDPYVAADIALKMAQVRRLDTESSNETKMTRGQLERWAKENGVSLAQAENYQALTNKANAEYSKTFKEMAMLDQSILDKIYENAFKAETYDERVQATMAEYGMTKQKAKKYEDILSASLADTWASANLKKKQSWQIDQLTPEEVDLKRKITALYKAQRDGAVTQNQILELDRDLKAYYGDAVTVADIMSKGGKSFQGFNYMANGLDDPSKLTNRRKKNQ